MSKWSRSLAMLLLSSMVICGGCWRNPLKIEISVPTKRFVQAEPVPIRVEITNRSKKKVEVIPNLDEYVILRFRVTDPDGRSWIPGPLATHESREAFRKILLNPGDKLTHTVALIYGRVDGVAKFVFSTTGRYRIEAHYDPEETGKVVSSEPITIAVVKPDGVDRQAQRLFVGREQGELVCGYGISQAAVDTFQQIVRRYPTSRFAPYAAFYLGQHYPLGLPYRGQRDHKKCIEFFERILADYRDFPLRAEVRFRLAYAYSATRKRDHARECLRQLASEDPSGLIGRRAKEFLRELDERRN